jgi:hypothetical protein
MKTCTRCGKPRPLADFHKRARSKDGRHPYCKTCNKANAAEWRRNNPERRKAISRRYHLDSTYGLSTAEYDAMLAAQGGGCAICHRPEPMGRGRFHVDHCHETGRVRALLCDPCNRGIGLLRDNPEVLRAAAAYLELHHNA